MSGDPGEPPRQVAHFLFLVALAFLVIGSAIASRRPIMGSYPRVVDGGAVPDGADEAMLRRYASAGAAVMRIDWRPEVGALLGRNGVDDAPPRMGWFVRQWTFLGLPVVATGWQRVLWRDTPGLVQATPVTDPQMALLARAAGGEWKAGMRPWWRVGWGWVGVALIALFAWFEHRWQVRRRTLLGLI